MMTFEASLYHYISQMAFISQILTIFPLHCNEMSFTIIHVIPERVVMSQ